MSITTPDNPRKPDFNKVLRKERRFWEYADGNRNDYTSANVYWRLIGGWQDDAADLCANHALHKSHGEARYIEARTQAMVNMMNSRARVAAILAYRRNSLCRDRHINGAHVLAVCMVYARQNGYCSAKQESIANAAGLSRKAINQTWLPLLQKAGLIEHVGYDARGHYVYKGRQRTKWCKVFTVSVTFETDHFSWHGSRGYTIPKSIVSSVPKSRPKRRSHRVDITHWTDVHRSIGPPRVMDTIACFLVGEMHDGQLVFRPALAPCAFQLLRDCRRVWLRILE